MSGVILFVILGSLMLLVSMLNNGTCRLEKVPKKTFDRPVCIAITGASSGIGLGMARILNENHPQVKLIVTGRTKERAEAAVSTNGKRALLAASLDLDDSKSIDRFLEDLRLVVDNSCNGRLDYLFLNAGMIYAPGYNESYVSKDGLHDKLFSSNFIGHMRLLKGIIVSSTGKTEHTRVIYVSSIAHFSVSINKDAVDPRIILSRNDPVGEILAYSRSKLAMTSMQQVLAKDGVVPNSVVVSRLPP